MILRDYIPPADSIVYYPYRTAEVRPWLLRIDRNSKLAQVLEIWLCWCVGRPKDDKVVYGLPLVGHAAICPCATGDDVKRFAWLYFWFWDKNLYIGTEIIKTKP